MSEWEGEYRVSKDIGDSVKSEDDEKSCSG